MDVDMSVAFTEADSDQEMESLMVCENENEEEVSDTGDEIRKVKKKHAKKLLSDSEDENEDAPVQEKAPEEEAPMTDNESSVVASPVAVRKKISALIDSDSEPEVTNETGSDVEGGSNKTVVSESPKRKQKKKGQKKRPSPKKQKKKKSNDILAGLNLDFGSSSESSSDESIAGSAKSSKSGSRSENGMSGDEFVRNAAENDGHPDGGKKQRMSAKEAMENMKIIQSESQRMAREAYVDIPYHKPKQHSLKEFLSRKSVVRKELPRTGVIKTTAATIKMSQEELEAYEKLLKEREREATEFFKSESEPEDEGEPENIDKPEEEKAEDPATIEVTEKTTSDLLREIEALTSTIGPQDNTMSLNEEAKAEDENPVIGNISDEKEGPSVTEKDETTPEIVPEEDSGSDRDDPIPVDSDPEHVPIQESPEPTLATKIEAKKSKLRSLLGELPEIKPLSCDPTLVIDLETGDVVKRELTGPELLKEKYLKNAIVKSQVPHDTDLQIVSMENGLHVEHVTLKADIDTLKVKKDVKPGAAYVKLKQELEKKITESRMKSVHEREGYAKKLEEEQAQYSGDEEEEDMSDVEETEIGDDDGENELKEPPPENDLMEADHVEEEAGHEGSNSDSSSDSSDEEDIPDIPSTTNSKKGRILKAFVDSDEETEAASKQVEALNGSTNTISEADISLSDSLLLGQLMPSDREGTLLETSMTSDTSFKIPETPMSDRQPMESLWDDPLNRSKDDVDLSDLCSGRFDPTQASIPDLTPKTLGRTQDDSPLGIKALCDKGLTQAINDEDLSELCSGTFVTQVKDPKGTQKVSLGQELESTGTELVEKEKISPEKNVGIGKRNVIVSSDEENKDEDIDEVASAKKVKKLKKKRRRQALEISDDESSDSEQEEEDIEAEESPVEDPEEAEVFMDYDSEENEIEVKLTKKDREKAATNYFENEAELSGSEYGSADEDEKDLDRFEKELGDDEQFDQDQLQSELGKIHMRRVLDQDNREVKILQEMFFEDEEKDGVGRTRKFMWKNVDGVMNLMEGNGEGEDDQGHHSDDENEEEWRKMRHEREVFLAKNNEEKENSLQLTLDNVQETIVQTDSATITETAVTKKRLTIIRKSNTSDTTLTDKNSDSPFLISFDKITKGSRASFLTRDEETLNKLAGMVREKDGDVMPTALGKGRNFVFSVVTPPPPAKETGKQPNKRPSDAGVEEFPDRNKRQKVEKPDNNKFKKRLLDSLA